MIATGFPRNAAFVAEAERQRGGEVVARQAVPRLHVAEAAVRARPHHGGLRSPMSPRE
jgi:hypothetical protein